MGNVLTKTVPDEVVADGSGNTLQLVSFRLGQEIFAIDILGVQEIIRLAEITPVPNAPRYVEGVVNLRGKVIPIIHLRTRFGLPAATPTKDTRIVVVEVAHMILGFTVDSVEEVLRLPEECLEILPPNGRGGAEECHRGIGRVNERLVMVLDLELLFRSRTSG